MRVLGIDPSLQSTGFGIVEEESGRLVPVAFGVIRPTAKLPLHLKLAAIKAELEELIRTYRPAEASIENTFYAQNMKTALVLGQVRGAVLVAVAGTGCGLAEYSALEIKKAVTGYGQADKEQVLTMVRSLLGLDDDRIPLDASDALAAAICHLNARATLDRVDDKEPS